MIFVVFSMREADIEVWGMIVVGIWAGGSYKNSIKAFLINAEQQATTCQVLSWNCDGYCTISLVDCFNTFLIIPMCQIPCGLIAKPFYSRLITST